VARLGGPTCRRTQDRERLLLPSFNDVAVAVIERETFIANSRATGRLEDLADVERLLRPRLRNRRQ
jgi:hypothetical protein